MDASKAYVLICGKENIREILHQPIVTTQRIKYTSFDVSQSYIILGASSGGLYIFAREHTKFLQILPNQDGPISLICISPNEKYVACFTSKKVLCIFQFADANKILNKSIYRESLETTIVYMKWNLFSSEIFLGDILGQICVVVIADFLAKTMFQSSCYPLMRLDSQIVQLDWSSSLLFASTTTRCYICDTEKEEYRQIGQKLRDGQYGGCFVSKNLSDTSIVLNKSDYKTKNWFKTTSVSMDDTGCSNSGDQSSSYFQHLRIFCNRPGARVWEVNVNGTVLKTLQFKDACTTQPSDVIVYNNDPQIRLELLQQNSRPYTPNFSLVYVLRREFLVTFKENNLYILHPETTSLAALYTHSELISDIRIVDSDIYLWSTGGQISLLHFTLVEKLLMRSFFNKNYLFCGDLCLRYKEYLMQLVPTSGKLYLLSSLKTKLETKYMEEFSELEEFFECLEKDTETRQKARTLTTGVHVVDNVFYNIHNEDSTAGEQEVKVHKENPAFNIEVDSNTGDNHLVGNIVKKSNSNDAISLYSSDLHPQTLQANGRDFQHSEEIIVDKREKLRKNVEKSNKKSTGKVKKINRIIDLNVKSPSQLDITNCHGNEESISYHNSKSDIEDGRTIEKIQNNGEIDSSISSSSVNNDKHIVQFPNIIEPVINKPETATLMPPNLESQQNVSVTPVQKAKPQIDILYQYFKLSRVSKMYNCPAIDEILQRQSSIVELFELVKHLNTHIRTSEIVSSGIDCTDDCKLWCFNLFLRYLDLDSGLIETLRIIFQSGEKIVYLVEAFTELNICTELACTCGFPLPYASAIPNVRYFQVGQTLIDFLWSAGKHETAYSICKNVPYMWKVLITHLKESTVLIPLIIQFNDQIILENYLNHSDVNINNLLQKYIQLQTTSKCLQCLQRIDIATLFDWTKFACILLETLGGDKTLKYLLQYADQIPNGALDQKFYLLCLSSRQPQDFPHYSNLAEKDPKKFADDVETSLLNQFAGINFHQLLQ